MVALSIRACHHHLSLLFPYLPWASDQQEKKHWFTRFNSGRAGKEESSLITLLFFQSDSWFLVTNPFPVALSPLRLRAAPPLV